MLDKLKKKQKNLKFQKKKNNWQLWIGVKLAF